MNKKDSEKAFQIPSFARAETYNFEVTPETFDLYRELSHISEEIEKCRLENS